MKYWEISGNLDDPEYGLANFNLFIHVVACIKNLFDSVFGLECMNKVHFLVDNAISKSGYTPICTVILEKFIVIKLRINDNDDGAKIAFQFAHELMHLVFYSYFGLNKPLAGNEEEAICVAASLLSLKKLFPESLDRYISYLKNDSTPEYAQGVDIAESVNYEWSALKELAECFYMAKQNDNQFSPR